MSVLGDCKYALRDLLPLLKFNSRADWVSQINYWREENPFKYQRTDTGLIKTQQVIHEIYKHTHQVENKFISTGVGNHQMMSCQFYRWTRPRQILSSGSLGTMGVGLPFAIGAQMANPSSLVICIDGDGSFNMTHNELYSVAKYNLPIKIAIMNDSRQQMVYVWQKLFFDKRYIGTENSNPDYCKLAAAWDIPSVFCDTEDNLSGAVDEWLNTKGPCLAEFKVVPDICLPMVAPGKALDEMIINRDNNMNSVRLMSYIPSDSHAPS
jgi:acetolactate synthase-1/2/3 large subunit